MSLIEQWANNIGATQPVNGSWIEAIALSYNAPKIHDNRLLDIARALRALPLNGNIYHSIAIKISNNSNVLPLNGSWLSRIVQLTT